MELLGHLPGDLRGVGPLGATNPISACAMPTAHTYLPADRILWLDLDTRERKHGTLIERFTIHAEGYSLETVHDVEPYPVWQIRGDDGKLYELPETLIRPLVKRETKAQIHAAPVLH